MANPDKPEEQPASPNGGNGGQGNGAAGGDPPPAQGAMSMQAMMTRIGFVSKCIALFNCRPTV